MAQTYTLFGSTTPDPPNVDSGDTNTVSVGVVFYTQSAGTLTKVRFYKAAANTGTHQWYAWNTVTGAQLDTDLFTGETASGWQEQAVSPPLALSANTYYTISVYMPVGHYSATGASFGSDIVLVPLVIPSSSDVAANTPAAGNGVFDYGAVFGQPTNSFNDGNYWIDLELTIADPPDIDVDVTGQSVTTAMGSVTTVGKAVANVTGEALPASLGDVIVIDGDGVSVSVTGNGPLTVGLGDIGIQAGGGQTFTVHGEQVTVFDGIPGFNMVTVLPIGEGVTVEYGISDFTSNVSYQVTGSAMTSGLGNETVVTIVGVMILGNTLTAETGFVDFITDANVAVAGSFMTISTTTPRFWEEIPNPSPSVWTEITA